MDDIETERTGPYQVRLIGVTGKSFTSESGLVYKTRYTLRNAVLADTVIIPGGAAVQTVEASRKIAEWLSSRAASLRRISSVCVGIYTVGKAGLLETRKITTH